MILQRSRDFMSGARFVLALAVTFCSPHPAPTLSTFILLREELKVDVLRLCFDSWLLFMTFDSLRGHPYMTSALRGEGGLAQKKM